MKKLFSFTVILALSLGWTGFHPAEAVGPGAGYPGKPEVVGLDHAETIAGSQGRGGIEKAESKQNLQKKPVHKKGRVKTHAQENNRSVTP